MIIAWNTVASITIDAAFTDPTITLLDLMVQVLVDICGESSVCLVSLDIGTGSNPALVTKAVFTVGTDWDVYSSFSQCVSTLLDTQS